MDIEQIANIRRDYIKDGLREDQVEGNPVQQFKKWLDEAVKAELVDATAMTLATASRGGQPSARIVLLKDYDDAGFIFYGNYESQKGQELADNPKASLLFYWRELERQVRITGGVSKTSRDDAESYFHSRPLESQVAGAVSQQSSVLGDRSELDDAYDNLLKTSVGKTIPLPDSWGGYILEPTEIEFWQGGAHRLHDRLRYRRDGRRLDHRTPGPLRLATFRCPASAISG